MEVHSENSSRMKTKFSQKLSPNLIEQALSFLEKKFVYHTASKISKRIRTKVCGALPPETKLPIEFFKLNISLERRNVQFWYYKIKTSSQILFKFETNYLLNLSSDFNSLFLIMFLQILENIYKDNCKMVRIRVLISEKNIQLGLLNYFAEELLKFKTTILITTNKDSILSSENLLFPGELDLSSSRTFEILSQKGKGGKIEYKQNEKLQAISIQLRSFPYQYRILQIVDWDTLEDLSIRDELLEHFKEFFKATFHSLKNLKRLSIETETHDFKFYKEVATQLPALTQLEFKDGSGFYKLSELITMSNQPTGKTFFVFQFETLVADSDLYKFANFKIQVNEEKKLLNLNEVYNISKSNVNLRKTQRREEYKLTIFNHRLRRCLELTYRNILIARQCPRK